MNKKRGDFGEDLAVEYLENKGYQIVYRNFRFRQLEIDIVAKRNQVYHFVEVKLRGSDNFGSPASFVSKSQQKRIAKGAEAFINQLADEDLDLQFDIISVFKGQKGFELEHIKEAFRPPFN